MAHLDETTTTTTKDKEITVLVNNKPVTLTERRPTGLEIKQAAISQGVDIQVDFQLSHKVGKKFLPVGDDERVAITKNSEFSAVDGDDNS